MDIPVEATATAAMLILFSLISYGKKILDLGGTLVADVFGIIAFRFGGLRAFLALVLFYIAAVVATRIGRLQRPKHETRTMANIMGNGGPAIVCILAGNTAGFFGAISAALSDTFSSEIGMNSKGKPIMITTLQQAEKGTDGAVSLKGLFAGVVGGIVIGALYWILIAPSVKMFALIAAVGLAGSLIDSVLGATLQRRGLLDNNSVNFIASAAGAAVVVVVSAYF